MFALAEAYPDLKANQEMMSLMEELTSTENKISFARQAYNDAVTEFQFVTSHEGLPKYNDTVKRAYVNLAEIYEIAGKKDSAISMYEQSLRLDPGNSLIGSKISMLREGKESKPSDK